MAFFCGGTVRRTLRHGPQLAPASRDRQRADVAGRLSLAAFIAAMPLLHFLPMYRYLSQQALRAAVDPAGAAAASGLTLYDLAGGAAVAAAIALNWAAARALGAAYDRVVAPEALVTTGPYAHTRVCVCCACVLGV
jgi:protein-S-isoprenylcysteine O-methyltransferase Ste14